MLFKVLGDSLAQVHVSLEIGDAPAVHLKYIPWAGFLRNKIFPHQHRYHSLGSTTVLHIHLTFLCYAVLYTLLIESYRDAVQFLLIGNRCGDKRNHARAGAEINQQHYPDYRDEHYRKKDTLLYKRKLAPQVFNLRNCFLKKFVHFPSQKERSHHFIASLKSPCKPSMLHRRQTLSAILQNLPCSLQSSHRVHLHYQGR